MKTLQLIFLGLTVFTSCKKSVISATAFSDTTNTNKGTASTVVDPDTLNYLALGDSYTIGQSVELSQSYPYQLTNSLNLDFHSSNVALHVQTPTIIATTGWTTDDLISAIDRSGITEKKFSFVTLLIGVNDEYQHLSIDNYQVKFTQVLNTAINFANGDTSKVFVLSIPDYGVTPFAAGQDSVIGPQIDKFNAVNLAASIKAGVHYLNITGISREAATNSTLIAVDGLHPSPSMYQLWVEQLGPMVLAKF